MPRKAAPIPIAEPTLAMTCTPLAITVKQAAALINVSDKTMYLLTRRPDFPKVMIGTKPLIPTDALRRWLDENIGTVFDVYKEE